MKLRRTSALRIRVSATERAAIETAAAAAGLGPCSFARMASIRAAGRKPAKAPRPKPTALQCELAQWTGALGKVGNLLNQVARATNSNLGVSPTALSEIRDEIQKLRQIVIEASDRARE